MPPKVEIKKDKLTDAEKKKQKQANKVGARVDDAFWTADAASRMCNE